MGEVSWNPEKRTNAQMLESCYLNVADARRKLARLEQLYQELPIGDVRRNGDAQNPSLFRQRQIARLDVAHWEREIVWWRARCVDEGDDQVAGGAFDARRNRSA